MTNDQLTNRLKVVKVELVEETLVVIIRMWYYFCTECKVEELKIYLWDVCIDCAFYLFIWNHDTQTPVCQVWCLNSSKSAHVTYLRAVPRNAEFRIAVSGFILVIGYPAFFVFIVFRIIVVFISSKSYEIFFIIV